jgi:hypothetical protein
MIFLRAQAFGLQCYNRVVTNQNKQGSFLYLDMNFTGKVFHTRVRVITTPAEIADPCTCEGGKDEPYRFNPVSYTHLTLPTK